MSEELRARYEYSEENQDTIVRSREGEHWTAFANCGDTDPAMFNKKGKQETFKQYSNRLRVISSLCRNCVVLEECFDDAKRFNDVGQFRAGLTGDHWLKMSKNEPLNQDH